MNYWLLILFLTTSFVICYGSKHIELSVLRTQCRDEPKFCPSQAVKGACAGRHAKAKSVKRHCPCSCEKAIFHRIQTCCGTIGDQAASRCLPFCRYNTTIAEIATPAGFGCISQLQVWIYCAADEQNAQGCCQRNGVPKQCLSFCRGKLPTCKERELINYQICLTHFEKILQCSEKSLKPEPQWNPAWEGPCSDNFA